ncbi:hypothetical protein [Burkholderia ubonensis]|uniref:hypothetical protein n=1 Tax=Burkholderia ubonensis TaxID=101571 RepID=UPI000A693847|nr:hypothetical protein [Burkholderia ubonensis]
MIQPPSIQARVVYDPVRNLLIGTVLEAGTTIEAHDARTLAELLFAAGVRHGRVSMPDWREGSTAPATGDKIALNFRLNQLGQAAERLAAPRAVRVIEHEGRPYYVRLADVPQPWRDQFRAALRGSGCPVIAGEGECAYASDWSDWLRGSFPRW